MLRPRHRSNAWPRCRDSATGSSAPSTMPRASAALPTIRCWAGGLGTTAMLFIAEQRVLHQLDLAWLTRRDIVEMLKETLPRKPEGKEALVARINERHSRRRSAIESRFRKQRKLAPS